MLFIECPLLGLLLVLVLLAALTIMAFQTAPAAPAGPPISSAHYQLNWDVAANGGATMSRGYYVMYSTTTQSTHYKLNSGFWQKLHSIFLPFIRK